MVNRTQNFLQYAILSRPFGWDYTERSKLGLDHFQFEEIDPFYWNNLGVTYPYLGYYAAGIYVGTVFTLQRWMKNRNTFNLDKFFILWNVSLGIMSTVGFLRTFPGWWNVLMNQPGGLWDSVCVKKGADAQLIFWVVVWVLSKFVECGDTILLVLRKREVKLVHVIHHFVILLLAWNGGTCGEPVGRWLVVWNFAEHAMMYPYFAARAAGIKTPNFIPNLITTFQLVFVVLVVSAVAFASYFGLAEMPGYDCYIHPDGSKMRLALGFVFVLMFLYLFIRLVLMKGRQKQEALRNKKKPKMS